MKTALASSLLFSQVKRLLCLSLLALTVSACTTTQKKVPEVIVLVDDAGNVSDGRVNFKRDIAPLLRARCVSCHYDEGPLTGLSFQRRSALTDVEDGRSILVPGDPEKSTLFLVTVMPDYFVEAMPPTGHRLSDSEASSIYRWIAQGAEWPKGVELEPMTAP